MYMLIRCIVLSFLPTIALAQSGGAESDYPAALCWQPEALRATAAERVARRGGPGARMHAPKAQTTRARPVPAALRGSIRRVALPPGQKLIALTFDLCESNGEVAGYDGAIVDYLRANKVKATFFSGGKWLENHPERADQLITDPLFEMGNHSWTHRNLRKLTGKRLLDEITKADAAYAHARIRLENKQCIAASRDALRLANRITLFRFPYGTCSPAALQAVGNAGMLAIQWDVVTGDPAPGQSAMRIARTVMRHAKPGSIVVAHANGKGRHTAEALSIFVPRLLAMGYRFVTVSELLAAGTPVIADSCYELRPGDNDKY